jgi:DtxR family manganese transport transcriptional regulator
MNAIDNEKQAVVRLAERYVRVRDVHQREQAEDYVELIADLIDERGEARIVDLAGRLGVTNATVNNTVHRLQRDGLVTAKPYRSIFLTEEGRTLAERARERHSIVYAFLVALGVDAESAEADAEGVYHHVSDATLCAFRRYLALMPASGAEQGSPRGHGKADPGCGRGTKATPARTSSARHESG